MSYISGQTTVTGSVTTTIADVGIALPTASQTPINQNFTLTGSVATGYTVTSGKSFALFGIIARIAGGGGYCDVYKPDGTTMLIGGSTADARSIIVMSAVPIWVFTSGQAVKVDGTNAMKVNFIGVEYWNT